MPVASEEAYFDMIDLDDPCLDRLSYAYFGAIYADVPDLKKVRASRDLLCEYITWCIRNRLWETPDEPVRRPRLRVLSTDGPVNHNPRRMSSPIKTREVREFENNVGRVFSIDASATMEWRAPLR